MHILEKKKKDPDVHVLCSRPSFSTLLRLDKVRQLNEGEGLQSVEPVGVSGVFLLLLVSLYLALAGKRSSHNASISS